jgi:hypothetical protein
MVDSFALYSIIVTLGLKRFNRTVSRAKLPDFVFNAQVEVARGSSQFAFHRLSEKYFG